MCAVHYARLVRVLRKQRTWRNWHHDLESIRHDLESLCSDNDPRCHMRKIKIMSSNWIALLRRLLIFYRQLADCITATPHNANRTKSSKKIVALNFIPLWEWTWCHRVFYVRTETRTLLSGLSKIRARLQKRALLKRLHACRDALWRHVHSKSGTNLGWLSKDFFYLRSFGVAVVQIAYFCFIKICA